MAGVGVGRILVIFTASNKTFIRIVLSNKTCRAERFKNHFVNIGVSRWVVAVVVTLSESIRLEV